MAIKPKVYLVSDNDIWHYFQDVYCLGIANSYLSVFLFVHPYICLYVCPTVCLSISWPSVYLSVCLYLFCPTFCLSISFLSNFLSVYLFSVYLSVYLFFCPPLCLSLSTVSKNKINLSIYESTAEYLKHLHHQQTILSY